MHNTELFNEILYSERVGNDVMREKRQLSGYF